MALDAQLIGDQEGVNSDRVYPRYECPLKRPDCRDHTSAFADIVLISGGVLCWGRGGTWRENGSKWVGYGLCPDK